MNTIETLNHLANMARLTASRPPAPFKGLADDLVVEIFSYLTNESDLASFALSTRSVYRVWEENYDFINEVHDQHFRAVEKSGNKLENLNVGRCS